RRHTRSYGDWSSDVCSSDLQHLSIKLGVATGRDLAQACRDHYSTPVVWFLWILCELAIAACDLAEVVGSAIGLQLLFGIPLVWRSEERRVGKGCRGREGGER